MFNPRAYENSRADGIGVLEVGGDSADERRFVPLRRSELRGEVCGPLAALRLIQVYSYSHEQCDKVLEALYRFPLPGDAAITGVRVRFGDVEIRATLQERLQAETTYKQARREQRQAALLTREAPDVFTLQVAGLQPDQEIVIETDYVQLARPAGAGWSLRVPLTTAPRYVRSDELDSRHAHGQPLQVLRDPGHRFALDLSVYGAAAVRSPTHHLALTREGDRLRVRLEQGEVLPDRDCVISWLPAQEQSRPQLELLHHEDRDSGQVYLLALITPPAVLDRGQGVPREVVMLVDHSGSMHGAKWEAADWAVKEFLSGLSERDRFNLGIFHHQTTWFSDTLMPGTREALAAAIAFLERSRDSGGTELGVGLEQAFAFPRTTGEYARHVLVMTDAEVTDAGRILRLADQEQRQKERRRVSMLCIDAAPNSFLVHELTERGGGVARFLTSSPEEEDITTALDEVLEEWGEPVLAGLRLELDRPDVGSPGRQSTALDREGWSAVDLGDLTAGRSLWLAARVPRGDAGSLTARLTTADGRELASWRIDLDETAGERPALKTLFGARQVLGLEYLMHAGYSEEALRDQLRRLGYDPDQALREGSTAAPKVYAENTRRAVRDALHDLLVREALDYGLASAETAFVAVRSESGRPIEGTVAVANALPSGWSPEFTTPARASGSVVFAAADQMAPPQADMLSSMPPADYSPPSPTAPTSSSPGLMGLIGGVSQLFSKRPSEPPPAPSAPAAEPATHSTGSARTIFAGVPSFANGEALLFDSAQGDGGLPQRATISRLLLRFPGGTPGDQLDPDLTLLIFVGDMTIPRARVRLADLARRGGARPLNLLRQAGQGLRVVLQDPERAWHSQAPALEIVLEWQ